MGCPAMGGITGGKVEMNSVVQIQHRLTNGEWGNLWHPMDRERALELVEREQKSTGGEYRIVTIEGIVIYPKEG